MKTKVLSLVVVGGALAMIAWLEHSRNPARFPMIPRDGLVEVRDLTDSTQVPVMYRELVEKGLDFLVANQFADGHWEGDGGQHPVAMTALVGLALLMTRDRSNDTGGLAPSLELPPPGYSFVHKLAETAGDFLLAQTPFDLKHASQIRKAADWLMDRSQGKREGLILSEHPSETARYMEGHGLATLFLAGALLEEDDDTRRKKLTDILTRAVKYTLKAQSSQGGWHHTSKMEGHDLDAISATVIQVQALQAADNSGIPVNSAVNDAQEYLKAALGKSDLGIQSSQGRDRTCESAAAFACLVQTTNWRRVEDEVVKKMFKYCQTTLPRGRDTRFGRDELAHFYYAQAAFLEGSTWPDYRTTMFDQLQRKQNRNGSWPAGHGIGVGSVYATALWCIILQLDNKSHPSQRTRSVIN